MYLLRAIYANGNQYKTIDEIYNSLDPKMDKPEFDRMMFRLKELVYLDEHMTTYKIRVNNIGETNLILIDRQEEEERRRRDSLLPAKKSLSQKIKTIVSTNIKPFGKWLLKYIIEISIAVIATIVAAYLIVKYKLPH